MAKLNEKITIKPDGETRQSLYEIADAEGVTPSRIVRRFINLGLNENRPSNTEKLQEDLRQLAPPLAAT